MKLHQLHAKSLNKKGFTIIELMIATIVFSVVLLVVTYGIIQISRTYYKGVNESTTQTVARTVMDIIGQSIQFNGGDVTEISADDGTGIYFFCVGGQQYTFRPGWVVKDGGGVAAQHESPHGLYVRDNVQNCSAQPGANLKDAILKTGRELLSQNMRVASLKVVSNDGNDSQYRITIRIIFGADDFIYSPSDPDNINGASLPDATCKGSSKAAGASNAGTSQFCSVSELSTTVTKRVQ